MVYTYNGIIISHEKEENPVTCDNIDEWRGYYCKLNKPIIEGQILHDLVVLYMYMI